jgi:hypothetical protein
MKKLLLLLSIICVGQIHGQNWQWAKSGNSSTSSGTSEGYSVATDKSGNVYVTGYFSSPAITFGTYTLTNSGTNSGDVFIAKYDANGNILWAKSAGGTSPDFGIFVSTDASGNAYLMGYYNSSSLTFGTYTLTNTGNSNIFLAKYSPSGNVLWAKTTVGTGTSEAHGVATDVAGNSYITGDFNSPTLTFGTHSISNTGVLDVFLAKYDSSGNALWAKSAQGTSADWGNAVTTDSSCNVFITGRYDSPTLTLGTFTITNAGSERTFLAKYDSAGTVLWAKNVGTGTDDMGNAVATDASNNIYVTGAFLSSLTVGTNTLTNTGNYDVYLAKYNSAGNVLWAKSAIGAGSDMGYGVATDTSHNVYIAGRFSYSSVNSITFGAITLPYPASATDPMFITKYDSSGNSLCALALASGGDDNCGLATDISGNVFTNGDYMMSPFVVGTNTLSLNGTEDIFTAKANFTCPANGIDNLSFNGKINIYPNPTSDQFYIETNTTDKLNVDLYDVNGRHVFSANVNNKSNISVATLDNGVYTLTIKTADRVINKKIAIVR